MDSFFRDGLTFDVRDAGPADGEPVVLLHGFPQDSRSWDTVVPHLHRGGARTLRFDQRGYTTSARPTRTRDYRVARLGSDVLEL